MKYLAYYETLESSRFCMSNDIEYLKSQWCFAMRISTEELNRIEKPRFPKVKSAYKQIYSEGHLMHETE